MLDYEEQKLLLMGRSSNEMQKATSSGEDECAHLANPCHVEQVGQRHQVRKNSIEAGIVKL